MIEIIMLAIFLFGILALSFDYMREVYAGFYESIKSWAGGFKLNMSEMMRAKESYEDDKITNHIRRLLILTLDMGSNRSVKWFYIISGLAGAACIIVLGSKISIRLVSITTVMAMAMPYVLLRLRLEKLRIESSREGEILITELLNNYKINYFNMTRAVEITAITIEEAPKSKRLLFNLSKGMNMIGNEEELHAIIEDFRLSINTSWGNILSQNIYFAVLNGTIVTEAITDLAETVSNARKVDEFQKRQNNEARLILKYLVPAGYMITIIGSTKFFGMEFTKFIRYQFGTEVGITWFVISLIVYVSGVVMASYISRNKLDF